MKFERKRVEKDNIDIFQRITGSKVGGSLLIILSGILIYNITKSMIITSEKVQILSQAEKEVSNLRLDNLENLLLIEYMTSDEYLETEARNRLNLSKKGEVAFVIPEEILEKGLLQVERILNEDERVSDIENWRIWQDFFIVGI